jgi:RNA polymerase sigma factor (sigma-70 family)
MAKDKYIWIGGVNVPVTEDVYRAYKRAEWREDKQDEVRFEKECSFDFMEEHDLDGQTVANQALVEEIVEDKMMLETLYTALAELADVERELINALFFDEKTEREYAQETGIPNQTIHSRKTSILKRLKKLLENNL